MKPIFFKLIPTDYTSPRVIKSYVVKQERKIRAKIYQYSNGSFSVEINGLQWEKTNLKECLLQVTENYNSMLEVLNFSQKIQIVELFNRYKHEEAK